MPKKTPRLLIAFLLLVLVSAALSCSRFFSTPIKQILNHPRKYNGRTVTVSGTVTESANLLLFRYFKIKDDTGEITVVTDNAVPKTGEQVTVTGVVNQAFSIGSESLIVIRERPKNGRNAADDSGG
ncbi:MAG: hypothetical protein P8Z49_07200 [Acidobacteriota bacterium]